MDLEKSLETAYRDIHKEYNEKGLREENFVKQLRESVPHIFYPALLLHFTRYTLKRQKLIRSKYFLKNLVKETVGLSKFDFKDKVVHVKQDIRVTEEKGLRLGAFTKLVYLNNLKETKKYLKEVVKETTVVDLETPLLTSIDKDICVEKIYYDLEEYKSPLILNREDIRKYRSED